MTKQIETLVDDIYEVVSTGFEVNPKFMQEFLDDCKEALTKALKDGCTQRPPEIRMSMLGTPNRKLWYTFHSKKKLKPLKPSLAISFMYGHIVEAFMMLLVKQAGHTVTHQQETVKLEGVEGHIDGVVDGVIGDVKSASSYGFSKFKDKSIRDKGNDPYGYVDQLSAYAEALAKDRGFLLGVDKSSGELVLVDFDEFTLKNSSRRIKEVKVVIASPTPPEKKCYKAIPDGKSGNLILDKPCTWCEYKEECWSDANSGKGIREFQYANDVKYLVHVAKEPRVNEKDKEEKNT